MQSSGPASRAGSERDWTRASPKNLGTPHFIEETLERLPLTQDIHRGVLFALAFAAAAVSYSMFTFVSVLDLPMPVGLLAGLATGSVLLIQNRAIFPFIAGALVGGLLGNSLNGAAYEPFEVIIRVLFVAFQGWLAWRLTRRLGRCANWLLGSRSIALFLFYIGPVACGITALIVLGLAIPFGNAVNAELLLAAWGWWVRDMLGSLLMVPVLMSFGAQPRLCWDSRRFWIVGPPVIYSILVTIVSVRDAHRPMIDGMKLSLVDPARYYYLGAETAAVPVAMFGMWLMMLLTGRNVELQIENRGRIEAEESRRELHFRLQEVNDQLLAANTALEAANEELVRFADVASHDLRAPLRGIRLMSGALEEELSEGLSEDAAQALRLLQSRVGRMEAMVSSLHTFALAGRHRYPVETINVRQLVSDVASLAGYDLAAVELSTEVVGHRVPLSQVFNNLVSNAFQHSHREHPQVRIRETVLGDTIRYCVEDDGPGIDARNEEEIFEPFVRLRSRDQVEGSGIGLAIVRRHVDAQGGSIHVERSALGGACFCFTWPLRRELDDEKLGAAPFPAKL